MQSHTAKRTGVLTNDVL